MSFINLSSGMTLADGPQLDAFSRLRVASPTNLFSVTAQYGPVSVQMERGSTGTGVTPTHSANTRMVALSCTAGSGTSYMQSFEYIPYQAGKSQEVACTFVCGVAVAGAVFEIGYFDTYNGLFFRQNGTNGLQVVRRTSTSGTPVDNAVNQADWNIDKLDGTGVSGATLDITKGQILLIDFQFLSMGRVRFGFDIGGQICYCHEFKNANNLAVPYMQSGTLPVQVLLTATSTGSTKTAYFKCAAVHSNGGFENDRSYAFSTPQSSLTVANGARTHAISIRPKTTYNGIINRELMMLGPLAMLVTGNYPVFWELCIGAAFSVAPTWADVNTAYSAFEYGTGGTFNSLSNGVVVCSGYVPATNQVHGQIEAVISTKYPCSLDRSGAVRAMGTYTLLMTGVGGSPAAYSAMNFKEVR